MSVLYILKYLSMSRFSFSYFMLQRCITVLDTRDWTVPSRTEARHSILIANFTVTVLLIQHFKIANTSTDFVFNSMHTVFQTLLSTCFSSDLRRFYGESKLYVTTLNMHLVM